MRLFDRGGHRLRITATEERMYAKALGIVSAHALLSATACALGVEILPMRLADRATGRNGLMRLRTQGF